MTPDNAWSCLSCSTHGSDSKNTDQYGGRAFRGSLQPLSCWDCIFKSRRGHNSFLSRECFVLCRMPMQWADPSSREFYRIFAGIADSTPAVGINVSSVVNELFCAGGLCNGPIPRPEESYRMFVSLGVVKCSIQLSYLRRMGTKSRTK